MGRQVNDTAPSPDRLASDRYTSLRAMLAKNAPLSLEQYLAAQTVFLLMDLLAEQQVQTEALIKLEAGIEEQNTRAWSRPVRKGAMP